jgi:hypothetical protein
LVIGDDRAETGGFWQIEATVGTCRQWPFRRNMASSPSKPETLVDEDLDRMSQAELAAEVRKLRAGVRAHRDSSGHGLCWHHPDLWGLLPEKTDPVPVVPEWPQFMRGCIHYRQSLDRQLPDAPRVDTPFNPET